MPNVALRFYFDFANDTQFNGADDISGYVMDFDVQRATDDALEPGIVQMTLNNTDGRFTPQSSLSVYGDTFTLGRRVKVTATPDTEPTVDELDSVTWDRLFCTPDGFEFDLLYMFASAVAPELAAEEPTRRSVLMADDLFKLLDIRQLNLGTVLDKLTGEIAAFAFDGLGFSAPGYWVAGFSRAGIDTRAAGSGAMWRDIDSGQSIMPFASFEGSCSDAIRSVVELEHGYAYMRRDGVAVFEDRHRRLRNRTALFAFTDAHIANLTPEFDDENLFNHIAVVAHPRSVGVLESICWDGIGDNDGHKITPGDEREYWVTWTDPETETVCEVIEIVDPLVASTDYLANAAADGSGANLTANLTVTLAANEFGRYKVTVTNDGSADLYVTKLQIRAQPLVSHDAVTLTAEDTASIAQFLQRDLTIDVALLNDPVEAQTRADFELLQRSTPKLRIAKMTIDGTTQTNLLQIMFREIGDRVSVTSVEHGIDGEFFITGINYPSIDAQAGLLSAEFALEQAPPNFWVAGFSRAGIDTRAAY